MGTSSNAQGWLIMASSNKESGAASAMLPAVVSVILTLIWGAYTVLVLVEILRTPLPA
jgi:hypothetical protein